MQGKGDFHILSNGEEETLVDVQRANRRKKCKVGKESKQNIDRSCSRSKTIKWREGNNVDRGDKGKGFMEGGDSRKGSPT